ncbi:BtrH N-terminal domain-containing protein [Actinoplanes utahensis]|uniref:BtrH N-terminal domain-containing protein n=1 Tax=Actinoplanes utahensis TaxID=1869 RepID=UPI001F174A9F|nr:BtrH N-terminal domain-containing protein [Actinoplanes utahensis]
MDFPGGQHCETTAAGALLRHGGLDLSEAMLFGLGEGLGFIYWDAKSMDVPFLGGRSKPGMIVRTLADRLGLALEVRETGSPAKAWRDVVTEIDAGRPVGLQLDSYHLEYFSSKVHFGGHVVAMRGYDDTDAYLVDTAQQGGLVRTSLASLAQARAARGPMTARHLSFTLTVPSGRPALGDVIRAAVRGNAQTFLGPPIANLGHRGIAAAAKRIVTWPDRAADPARDLPVAAMLMERGGTGGALFRNLYRDFLAQCLTIVDDPHLRDAHEMYAAIAPLWTDVATLIESTGRSGRREPLLRASALLSELATREHEAMRTLATFATG